MKRPLLALLALIPVLVVIAYVLGLFPFGPPESRGVRDFPLEDSTENPANGIRFVDVTEQAGIRFEPGDGRSGRKYFMETLGS